jgi:hypothetical protein
MDLRNSVLFLFVIVRQNVVQRVDPSFVRQVSSNATSQFNF